MKWDKPAEDIASYIGIAFLVLVIFLILYAGTHTGTDGGCVNCGWY